MKREIPKTYTCTCGRVHEFAAWVYAHWNILLVHRCECRRVNQLLRGQLLPRTRRTSKSKGVRA